MPSIGISPAYGKNYLHVWLSGSKETYYDYDQLQFDQYTGKMLLRTNLQEHNGGERLIGMNYDIHVGAIAGLPGKILAFIISLICCQHITGFTSGGEEEDTIEKPVYKANVNREL